MENKTHQSHALAITLFSLCAKQVNLVNLSHIFYKSCNFFPAFTSAIEQLSGNQINQSNQISSSVLHDQGRGEDDLDAGMMGRPGSVGFPELGARWVTVALPRQVCASPHCW